jgi:hypothetical protein
MVMRSAQQNSPWRTGSIHQASMQAIFSLISGGATLVLLPADAMIPC